MQQQNMVNFITSTNTNSVANNTAIQTSVESVSRPQNKYKSN